MDQEEAECESTAPAGPRQGTERLIAGAGVWPFALFVAWGILATINAGFIFVLPGTRSVTTSAMHHLYDVGHCLALGLISALLLRALDVLTSLLTRHHAALRVAVTWSVAGVFFWGLSYLLLLDDLSSFVANKQDQGSRLPWRVLFVSLSATLLVSVAVSGRLLSTTRWGMILLPLGVSLAIVQQGWFAGFYPGVHFLASICAAFMMAAGIVASGLANWLVSLKSKVRWTGGFLSACIAAYTVCVPPHPQVWHGLQQIPGSVAAPFLALNGSAQALPSASLLGRSKWNQDLSKETARPPSPRRSLPPNPIVLLVTVDALRADLLTHSKYRSQLPHLFELADRSLRFTQARSPSPSTASTFTALYTGKYYSGTRWKKGKNANSSYWPASDTTPRFVEQLSASGVKTVQVRLLDMFSPGKGIARGFDEDIMVGHYESASDGIGAVLKRLKKLPSQAPLFLAIHLIDPHAPYTRGGAKTHPGPNFDRYLKEVSYVDKHLGRLFRFLKSSPDAERTLLVVTSDHGEAFGEHGSRYHAGTLYEELLRVPLLVHSPHLDERTINDPVSLIDLGPTILDLFDQPTPGWYLGESLLPLFNGDATPLTRPLAAESGRRMQSLLLPNRYKAILDLKRNTQEVYNLNEDPLELHNLAGNSKEAESAMAQLVAFFRAHQLSDYTPPWRAF